MMRVAAAPDWFAKTRDDGMGCYVHIPFCDRICPYCDFAVVRYEAQPVARYMQALLREIDTGGGQLDQSAPLPRLQTLYLGGGTPSALSREQLARLTIRIFERFGTQPGSIECTLEANPARHIEDLPAYCDMGINRISIGVQSFDDAELHRLGREHTAAEAKAYYQAARDAGFENVSLDFIAGVPGQSQDTFQRSLQAALEMAPDHISVYALTVEAGTPYASWHARRPSDFPDEDAQATLLEHAHDVLTSAGMHHYEISNFALPGFQSAHNSGYWRQRKCLAYGLSAAGYANGVRYRNSRSLWEYCAKIDRLGTAREDEERLSRDGRLGEAAMLALRTSAGIEAADFQQRFGVRVADTFGAAFEKCKALGLLEVDARGARLTRSGRLLANNVCAEFVRPEATPA